ncbi:MAG: metal-dependent hydrolase [archaeon]
MTGYKEHITLGILFTVAFFLILYFAFKIDVLSTNILVPSIITILIFSLLPDIDHKESIISGFLHVVAGMAIIAIIAKAIPLNYASFLTVAFVGYLEYYHWSYARADRNHRQFPHTFTFGIISSAVFFFITLSWVVLIVAFLTFVSHILADGYIPKAIQKDKELWQNLFSRN